MDRAKELGDMGLTVVAVDDERIAHQMLGSIIGESRLPHQRGNQGHHSPYEAPDCTHIYHLYTLCVEQEEIDASRDDSLRVLYDQVGIQGILHCQPIHHLTGLKKMGCAQDICPIAEKFFNRRAVQ